MHLGRLSPCYPLVEKANGQTFLDGKGPVNMPALAMELRVMSVRRAVADYPCHADVSCPTRPRFQHSVREDVSGPRIIGYTDELFKAA